MSELANIREASGASFIYRENNSRYIGVQYSVEGRDLGSVSADIDRAVAEERDLPKGTRIVVRIEDLTKHTLIVYGETAAPEIRDVNWLQDSTRRLSPDEYGHLLRINNITGILHAAEAGVGIAALPDFVAAQRPGLERILPDIEGPTFDVHLVYCDALRQSKRVGAFRDFLVRAAKEWKY